MNQKNGSFQNERSFMKVNGHQNWTIDTQNITLIIHIDLKAGVKHGCSFSMYRLANV